MEKLNIAIDGPAGAGKSTIAKILANRLNFIYVDTGAMYRALTLLAMETKTNLNDDDEITKLLKTYQIKLENSKSSQIVKIDSRDVTEEIRTPEVTKNVSLVSSHLQVRKSMLEMQRDLAKDANVVMDGRDIGTHVLPHAEIKIFLTASIEKRANRRYEELIRKGFQANLEKIKEDIALRDKKDQEREVAPLRRADDAILLDSSNLAIEEVVDVILKYIDTKMGEK